MVGKGGALEKAGNVINLLFEGNWMPVKVGRLHVDIEHARDGSLANALAGLVRAAVLESERMQGLGP